MVLYSADVIPLTFTLKMTTVQSKRQSLSTTTVPFRTPGFKPFTILTKLSQTGSFLAWRFNFTPFFLFFPFLSLSFCPVCLYFVTRVKMMSKHNPLDKSNGGSEDEIDSGRPAQCSMYPVNHQQSRFDWDKPVSNVVLLPRRSKLIEKNSTLTRQERDVWNWIVLLPCSTRYTAVARLGFKRRAAAVPNLINKINTLEII